MQFIDKAGSKVTETIIHEGLRYIRKNPEQNMGKLFQLISHVPGPEYTKFFLSEIGKSISDPSSSTFQYVKKMICNCNQEMAAKLLTNLIYYVLLQGPKKAEGFRKGQEVGGPFTILISPTMRCNLRCTGCYAGEYSMDSDLTLEDVERIIREGKELGTYMYTILGGEPFLWKDIFEVFAHHDDCLFHVFTNGLLLDEEKIKRIIALKNITVNFSIEGSEEETDLRRGPGTYKKVVAAMEKMRDLGGIFGFSVTATHQNFPLVTSREFLDFVERLGPIYGWYFMYMPVGRDASVDLMLTPQERVQLGRVLQEYRSEKPLFVMDFFNDAPFVGGCISGGRCYMHINHKGDVEPCIFLHYAQDNIKKTSLRQALNSKFFCSIREKQPYDENLLTPCMMIDHPEIWRRVFAENKDTIYPTHPGANDVLFAQEDFFNRYGREICTLTQPLWEDDSSPWRKFREGAPQE